MKKSLFATLGRRLRIQKGQIRYNDFKLDSLLNFDGPLINHGAFQNYKSGKSDVWPTLLLLYILLKVFLPNIFVPQTFDKIIYFFGPFDSFGF